MPANNTSGLNERVLRQVHNTAPFLIVCIDLCLAHPLSTKYSARSGIQADRLLMLFRLFSAWLLSLVTTVFLHENCFGGWKLFWIVCQKHRPEHESFNWKVWDEEILSSSDMCGFSKTLTDGRCSRSIVDGLAPLLLKKPLHLRSQVTIISEL